MPNFGKIGKTVKVKQNTGKDLSSSAGIRKRTRSKMIDAAMAANQKSPREIKNKKGNNPVEERPSCSKQAKLQTKYSKRCLDFGQNNTATTGRQKFVSERTHSEVIAGTSGITDTEKQCVGDGINLSVDAEEFEEEIDYEYEQDDRKYHSVSADDSGDECGSDTSEVVISLATKRLHQEQ